MCQHKRVCEQGADEIAWVTGQERKLNNVEGHNGLFKTPKP